MIREYQTKSEPFKAGRIAPDPFFSLIESPAANRPPNATQGQSAAGTEPRRQPNAACAYRHARATPGAAFGHAAAGSGGGVHRSVRCSGGTLRRTKREPDQRHSARTCGRTVIPAAIAEGRGRVCRGKRPLAVTRGKCGRSSPPPNARAEPGVALANVSKGECGMLSRPQMARVLRA